MNRKHQPLLSDKDINIDTLKRFQKDKKTIRLFAVASPPSESQYLNANLVILSNKTLTNYKKILSKPILFICLANNFALPTEKITAKGQHKVNDVSHYIGNSYDFMIDEIITVTSGAYAGQYIVMLTRIPILQKNRVDTEQKLNNGETLNVRVIKLIPTLGAILLHTPETIMFLTNNDFSDDYTRASDELEVGDNINVKKVDKYPFNGDQSRDYRLFVQPEHKYHANLNKKFFEIWKQLGSQQAGYISSGIVNINKIYVHTTLGLDAMCYAPAQELSKNSAVPLQLEKIIANGKIISPEKAAQLPDDEYITGTVLGAANQSDSNNIVWQVQVKLEDTKLQDTDQNLHRIEIVNCENPDKIDVRSSIGNYKFTVAFQITKILLRGRLIDSNYPMPLRLKNHENHNHTNNHDLKTND